LITSSTVAAGDAAGGVVDDTNACSEITLPF
jgi:hypothetical protein